MKPNKQQLGRWIRSHRFSACLNQRQLADAIGWSPASGATSISNYERGLVLPRPSTFLRIVVALGIDPLSEKIKEISEVWWSLEEALRVLEFPLPPKVRQHRPTATMRERLSHL